jgi:hypothetical protein
MWMNSESRTAPAPSPVGVGLVDLGFGISGFAKCSCPADQTMRVPSLID